MTTPQTLFLTALDVADTQVGKLEPEQWTRQSPCSEWDARDVLVHVTGTLRKVGEMIDHGTYAPTPGATDAKPDPEAAKENWTAQTQLVRTTVAGADAEREVHTPMGTVPLGQGLGLPTADLAVHAWDIAAAAGQELELPDELLSFVRGLVGNVPPEVRAKSFGDPVRPPAGASPTEQLMAELGRTRP